MIEVRAHRSIEALRPLRDEMDALNRASRRRCPFTTPAFLENVVRNDEVFRGKAAPKPLFLTAHECGRLVGYMALRESKQRVGRLSYRKLEWLLTLEVDRPHLVCHPEDERAVARAMWRHLLARGRPWSMIELVQQDERSELFPLPDGLPVERFLVRTMEGRQCCPLRLREEGGAARFGDVAEYVAALSRKQRSNTKRAVLDLLQRPGVAFVSSDRPEAAKLLFELYLDVERRSWKSAGDAAIARSKARLDYYRALLDERQPMRLCVDVLLEDGIPVAGHIVGEYARRAFFLQTVYDDGMHELSPGTLMLLLSVKQAIERGVDEFDMLPDFAYYKSRWLADVVDTADVQVFRKGSLPWLKAVLGDFKRRVLAKDSARPQVLQNPSKLEAKRADGPPPPPPDRALAARVLAALAEMGVRPQSGEEVMASLPFEGAVRVRRTA